MIFDSRGRGIGVLEELLRERTRRVRLSAIASQRKVRRDAA